MMVERASFGAVDVLDETIATFLGRYERSFDMPPVTVFATDSGGWAEAKQRRTEAELAIMAMDPAVDLDAIFD